MQTRTHKFTFTIPTFSWQCNYSKKRLLFYRLENSAKITDIPASGSTVKSHGWAEKGRHFFAKRTISYILLFQGYPPILEAITIDIAWFVSNTSSPRGKWRTVLETGADHTRKHPNQNKKRDGNRDWDDCLRDLPEWLEEFTDKPQDTEVHAPAHISQDLDSERPWYQNQGSTEFTGCWNDCYFFNGVVTKAPITTHLHFCESGSRLLFCLRCETNASQRSYTSIQFQWNRRRPTAAKNGSLRKPDDHTWKQHRETNCVIPVTKHQALLLIPECKESQKQEKTFINSVADHGSSSVPRQGQIDGKFPWCCFELVLFQWCVWQQKYPLQPTTAFLLTLSKWIENTFCVTHLLQLGDISFLRLDGLLAPVRSGSLTPLSGRFLLQLAEGMKCSVLDNVRDLTAVDYGTVFDPRREHVVRARLHVFKQNWDHAVVYVWQWEAECRRKFRVGERFCCFSWRDWALQEFSQTPQDKLVWSFAHRNKLTWSVSEGRHPGDSHPNRHPTSK